MSGEARPDPHHQRQVRELDSEYQQPEWQRIEAEQIVVEDEDEALAPGPDMACGPRREEGTQKIVQTVAIQVDAQPYENRRIETRR